MRFIDLINLSLSSLRSYPFRAMLTAFGIAIGIAAVVLLTALGDGLHQFVLSEFTQFGTHLIGISPGRTTTHGVSPGVFGTTRPLTLDDADALKRIPQTRAIVPVMQGAARIKWGNRSRDTTVLGVGPAAPEAWQLKVASGTFLPADDTRSARSYAVLGHKVRTQVFGDINPLGARISVAGESYRVIGVMAPKGQILGFDLDDTLFIPVSKALSMFNRDGLMEVDILYDEGANVENVVAEARRILTDRHQRDDVTIITQQEMLDVLGSVLSTLTFAVAALGGISLFVGSIGVLTIMTIAVQERTSEVGLLRALGARRGQILAMFLGEAVLLTGIGGLMGLIIGLGSAQLLSWLVPALPLHVAWDYVLAALCLSVLIGLLAGSWPATRAARLNPVEALRAE